MTKKFKVNQMLTAKNTGYVEKIYAVTPDGQPFDLLEVSVLLHYNVLTLEALQERLNEQSIQYDLIQSGNTYRVSLKSKEDAQKFIDHIAPLYDEILL